MANEDELLSTASAYCANNGILVQTSTGQQFIPAPFSLNPTPFPRHVFETAQSLSFNSVVHAVATDYEWLRSSVSTTAEVDKEFTGRLLDLADEVSREGRTQNVVLGILRSDYMLHSPTNDLSTSHPLQVELNTIASSFGGLSTKLTQMHRYLNSKKKFVDDVPVNEAADLIAGGIAAAFNEFVRQRDGSKNNCAVIMVVQPGETNSCDQRTLEFILGEKHGVPLVRKTLLQMSQGEHGPSNELVLREGDYTTVAAVIYYRAGYGPDDYPTEQEWTGRWKAEKSTAIKSPDVFYHLVGTKKIQQKLAEPGILSNFTPHHEKLSATFAGLYSLGKNDDEIVSKALSNPHDYVLKPQREGGGNNLYDVDLKNALETMSERERGGFILMQKIIPPQVDGTLVRNGTEIVYEGKCVSELGVFGASVRSYVEGDEDIMDKVGGFILRSKSVGTDEGGVAAGYAFLSSPALV